MFIVVVIVFVGGDVDVVDCVLVMGEGIAKKQKVETEWSG